MRLPSAKQFSGYQSQLLTEGYCLIPQVLSTNDCQQFIQQYNNQQLYRSSVDMQRYHFGRGQYKYFKAPLPNYIEQLRQGFYELLAATANHWAKQVNKSYFFPSHYQEFEQSQLEQNQTKTTPLILRYQKNDYNCLHQDISGDNYFPYQMIFVLSQSGKDFQGGEIVLSQQRPRMQTIAHVLNPKQGDCLIISANYHPCPGKRGNYRTIFKHGVAKISAGERYSLGIIFHNYADNK